MRISGKLAQFIREAQQRDSFWLEEAKLSFAIGLDHRCRSQGISKADLARKLGKSAAYITKIFRGDANLTIDSMNKLARVTGGKLVVEIADERPNPKLWERPILEQACKVANMPERFATAKSPIPLHSTEGKLAMVA